MTLLPFLFLALAFLSLWVKKKPLIWGTLLLLTLVTAFLQHLIAIPALLTLALFILLWIWYYYSPTFLPFVVLTLMGIAFKLYLIPTSSPLPITSLFSLSLSASLIGLFPLALCVPLLHRWKELPSALFGLLIGCAGIAILALLAILSHAVPLHPKIPSEFALRSCYNLLLVAIPEEGFFRGFIQKRLCHTFGPSKKGSLAALLITSLLFTLVHIYWSPSLDILAFVFLASLLYGGVYLISKRIESAILCHFLLNLVHWTCFSYHAM